MEVLVFHKFRVFQDSICVTYEVNKKEFSDKRVALKKVYVNHLNPSLCCYNSLGVYLCVNCGRYEKSECIFQKSKGEDKRVALSG